jgi:23S rRNA pseudouridine2604 synthase
MTRTKLTAKHPRPAAPARPPVRPGARAQAAARNERGTTAAAPAAAKAAPEVAPKPAAQKRDHAPRPAQTRGPQRPARATPQPAAAPRRAPVRSQPSASAVADDTVRLSKRMSELGLCSRREADEWIANGWVRVDGAVVDTLGSKVGPQQKIEIVRAAREEQAKLATILIHKPVGYVSGQPEDDHQPAAVLITADHQWDGDASGRRFHPRVLRALAPAGRLDIDSTGLLVMTQDGRVAKQLIGESSEVDKEYLVRVRYQGKDIGIDARFPADKLALLRHGLSLDGVALRPAQVDWQNGEQLRFVLREGRKRQIRRMCEAVGLEVVGLKRIRIGRVMLGNLPPGQWRFLAPGEGF